MRSRPRNLAFLLALALLSGVPACKRPAPSSPESPAGNAPATPTPSPERNWLPFTRRAPTPPPPPPRIWELFDGQRAFEHTAALVALGPRPAGSAALEQARLYIENQLRPWGWQVERQEFDDQTPIGTIRFVNLIARRSPHGPSHPPDPSTQRFIVASHYETKYYDTIRFVGAHDAASSTGALIELARVLALDWNLAAQAELVFFDGEEAFAQFSETDGLYGSRHLARLLRSSGRNRQFEYGILWDMIGDRNFTITLSPDSPPLLVRGILDAAQQLGLRRHFSFFDRPILDDHVPLNQAGIPTINLIDFDYPYWHTADDTLDKLAPESIEKVGRTSLLYIHSRRR